MTALRLSLRMHWLEFAALTLLAAGFVLAAGWQVAELAGYDVPLACLGDHPPDGPACEQAAVFLAKTEASHGLLGVALFAPFIIGVLVGAPLAAAEIESGSAQLTWSLDRRSGRWFGRRLLVHGGFVIVLGAAVGLAANMVEAVAFPQWDPWASFHDFGSRGIPTVVRAMATLSLAALIGSVFGRLLPSIIVGGVLAAALAIALTTANAGWITPIAIPEAEVDSSYRVTGIAYGRDGEAFTTEQVAAVSPFEYQSDAYWEWLGDNYTVLSVVIPPGRYGEAVAVEAGALIGASVLAAGLTLAVIRRRRPHS